MSDSNIDDVARWLDEVVDTIDFELPGADRSLGRDLAGVVANGIIDRSVPDALDPDANPWAPNEEHYAAWKKKEYDADQPGVLTGQMLSLQSMMGETQVTSDAVEMVYGTNTAATRARNGADPPKAKEPPTDRQKAGWFTDGGREFFGLDEEIADDCVEAMGEGIDRYLTEGNP